MGPKNETRGHDSESRVVPISEWTVRPLADIAVYVQLTLAPDTTDEPPPLKAIMTATQAIEFAEALKRSALRVLNPDPTPIQ
jgi:hypothetical protein